MSRTVRVSPLVSECRFSALPVKVQMISGSTGSKVASQSSSNGTGTEAPVAVSTTT